MATDVSDVVDHARFNAYHLRIAALCSLMVFLDGFDLTAISYAAPQFIKLFGIERAMIAPVFFAGLLGLTLGALLFGLLADRLGAKRIFAACGVLFGVLSIATAVATTMSELLVYRFLAGLALGGASPISIAIASDYAPKHVRTSVTMIMYVSLSLGSVAAGYAYGFLTFFGWRMVFWIGGLLPVLLAPAVIALMPETLEFLVMHGAPAARIGRSWRGWIPAGTFRARPISPCRKRTRLASSLCSSFRTDAPRSLPCCGWYSSPR